MNELLNKKISDLTVLELLEVTNANFLTQNPSIDVKTMSTLSGNSIRRIYKLIDNKLIPECLLLGGFENRVQKKKLLFDTEKVIEWLKDKN